MGNIAAIIRTAALDSDPVSELIDTRWYADEAPQNAPLPHVVMHTPDDAPLGQSVGSDNTWHATLEIRCRAESVSVAQALADAVRTALKDYRTSSVSVVRMLSEIDNAEPWPDGSDKVVRVMVQDYSIWYTE